MAAPAIDPAALAARLATFRSFGIGVAHELAGPVTTLVTNTAVIASELAALAARLPADDPARAAFAELAEVAADVVAAAEQLDALAIALRALPSP